MKDVMISIKGFDLDFERARHLTTALAREANADTDLVAWFDRRLGRSSPSVDPQYACGTPDRPHWEKYGMSHGGQLKVIVNEGDYVMIYN
jgi:hypothetical protein